MIEILKSVRLSKGSKIAISVWFILLMLVVIIFLALRFMSKDRIDYADMIVESEASPQVIACKEKCKEIGNIDRNNLAEFNACEKACEAIVPTIFSYNVRLKFENPIFRAQKHFVEITPLGVEWSDVAKSLNLGGIERVVQDSKDSHFVVITLDSPLDIGQNLGVLSYKSKILSNTLKYSIKQLILILVIGIGLWVLPVSCRAYFATFDRKYPKITQDSMLFSFSFKDKTFLSLSAVVILGLFVFHFWLGYPGFHISGDTYNSIGLAKNNAHPVFIAYAMQFLYFIFGKHLYYLFLFNLVPFYAGLLFLVWGFYIRFRSVFAILLLFPIFIGNIYFQNFIQYHSFALPMLLFCGYAMVLFMLLVPLSARKTKIMWWLIGIVFFCAILWRHNAIFSVFPVSFVFVYMWLCNRGINTKEFVKKYINGVIACAILCLCVVIIVPRVLTVGGSYPANHPFLHQIAGACVPADDSSCFKDEWYYPHKGWEDIKALYEKYPLNADPFNVGWGYDEYRPIPPGKIDKLYSQWLKAILKYPINFAQHEWRFLQAMWIQNPGWIFDGKALQGKAWHPWHISLLSGFPESERSVIFTPAQEKIYDFLYEHRLLLNHFWGVVLSFGVMILSLILWLVKRDLRNGLLMFSFGVGFAGFFSALFIVLFTPVTESRYMSPILPLGLLAIIGFVAFMLDCKARHRADSVVDVGD